jgi:hypothetical protein
MKMQVLIELIQQYISNKVELESRGGSPGAPEATAEASGEGHHG